MKVIVKDEVLGDIMYNESMMTGKKTITVGGVKLEKLARTTYVLKGEDGDKEFSLKGNFVTGVKLAVDGRQIQLTPSVKWYEYTLAILSFMLLIVWSNVESLLMVLPIVGGGVGGAIYGICAVFSIILMKNFKQIWAKLLIWLGFTAIMFAAGYAIALFVLTAFF